MNQEKRIGKQLGKTHVTIFVVASFKFLVECKRLTYSYEQN